MRLKFHTSICGLLRIERPIFNGAMTPQAGGALARAVSDAGGFGMLGLAESETTAGIAEQIALVRADGNTTFGIGLVHWMLERRPELFAIALAAQPRLICVSFGDPRPYVDECHARGILVASQVQSRAWARTALDAGVDILIAQGTEAGGHTGSVGTLPLLQIILEMTQKPVLAAGGIATGRGLAAVIAAGAAGAWIGTPFLLARESRTAPGAQAIIEASDETQTIRTGIYDRLQNTGWPAEFSGRALRNRFLERWAGREEEVANDPDARAIYERAKAASDFSIAHLYAGEAVGLLHGTRTARAIVDDIADDAMRRLAAIASVMH